MGGGGGGRASSRETHRGWGFSFGSFAITNSRLHLALFHKTTLVKDYIIIVLTPVRVPSVLSMGVWLRHWTAEESSDLMLMLYSASASCLVSQTLNPLASSYTEQHSLVPIMCPSLLSIIGPIFTRNSLLNTNKL